MKLTPWEPDLRTIVDRIDSGDIDLQPDFQRQEVWSPTKKRKLIDTILRAWSIPPIFLVVTADDRMEVLDGQQRLASIRDFAHNNFSIDGNITPRDEKICSLHGKTYKRLEASDRRKLDHYTLRCFKITDYEPDEPSELFYRLNQPSMLTAGEQRNAFYGPAREQLKLLVREFEAGENDKKTIGFSNARLAYDDIIARLLFFIEAGSFAIKGTESLISQRFKERHEFAYGVEERARTAIRGFSQARAAFGPVRLNKASALSWLLFYARSGTDPEYIDFFERWARIADLSGPSGDFIYEAVSVFQDRASLRVTDVSSVAYRDFALWYIYDCLGGSNLPIFIDSSILERVKEALDRRTDATFEELLNQVLPVERWSLLQ